jgi:hypothetical protein
VNDIITPTINSDEIYEGKSFEETIPGMYRMSIENISVRKTQKGDKKLSIFLIHTEEQNKKVYKGVNGTVMLEGVDKNGKPLARQFGDFLFALGFAKEDISGGNATVALLGELDTADWKGVGALVQIKGDAVDLKGKEVLVKVEADTWQGKTRTKATSFYRVN